MAPEISGTSSTNATPGRDAYESEEITTIKNREAHLANRKTAIFFPKIRIPSTFLRNLKREHFEGTVISLGLFDRCSWNGFKDVTREEDVERGNDSLKIDVLIAFLADLGKGPESWVEISEKVVDNPEDMRMCYDQRYCCDLPIETIRSALALDAIFVSSFLLFAFYEYLNECQSLHETIHGFTRGNERMAVELLNDIFKMKNQIPLVLLKNVVSIIIQHRPGGLYGNIITADEIFQKICSSAREYVMRNLPTFQFSEPDAAFANLKYDHLLHGVAECFQLAANHHNSTESQGISRYEDLPTATELHKRGVTFQGHNDLFPKFKRRMFARSAILFMPKIEYISDTSEQIWRNLLAWDQSLESGSRQHFTSYMSVMDALIDSETDVSFLTQGKNPVIVGVGIGDNQAVAALFNSMTKNLILDTQDEWFSFCKEINDFHNHTLGRMARDFMLAYCSKPWLVISILAAFILLAATVFQTVYTVKSYYEN